MAVESRSDGPPDGPGRADPRASVDAGRELDDRETRTADAGRPGERRRVAYRCGACGEQFALASPGVAPCPRCQSVGDHDSLGPVGGVPDGH